jgi:hypothetical protein
MLPIAAIVLFLPQAGLVPQALEQAVWSFS